MLKTNSTRFYVSKKYSIQGIFVLSFMLFTLFGFAQETENESNKTGVSLGDIKMKNPSSIESKYTYDPISDRYIYTEKVGNFNINYPIILTPKEYQDLVSKENLKTYYKTKIDAFDGKKESAEETKKNLLPELYVNSDFFQSIFGGNTIEFTPNGSVEADLGILFTKQDNPSFSPRNRSNFTFDFDQRISLSLLGKVGERLQISANYDTESTFDFQNLIKLEFTPTQDDIIQKIEVGNVNMSTNNSLITGAQSLFGVKTQLKFGRTTITGVFSEQRSDTRTVVAQGGGTLDEFDFFIQNYDDNRHFFLAHYFRDTYDKSLENYPYINSNVQITRIEVWVTNRGNRTNNVRNIIALQDLAETDRVKNGVTITAGPGARPDNDNNGLNPETIGVGNSQLTEAVRDIATAQNGISVPNVSEGFDFAKLENARKLIQGQEFTFHPQLGYISLRQRLNTDEVLGVAYQYTINGEVHQVGEFANGGVESTEVNTNNSGTVTSVNNKSLVVKLLKSAITSTAQPVWDLMMKNVYDTGAFQLSQDDFKLNIFYTEASALNYITPVEGTAFPTLNGKNIEELTLLKLFNFDRLNFNNDPQANGDGFFDFVPQITVMPQNGKIIFTKAEPFGEYLFNVLKLNSEQYNDTQTYNDNQKKYVYDVLYKETKTAALDQNEKNKFQIKGRYKSSGGGEGIPIGSFNVPRGSVKVTAGGRVLVEGVDYTVNYQLGRVQILDESLKASNTPIQVSTENNAIFGQQTKRFLGLNVDYKFNENFVLGATFLNLRERPLTQKANFNTEPINNTMLGLNGNYSTEVPFLTRLVNKLPNIDTDATSNLSIRGDFAYLLPGSPKATDFNNEPTAYIDDFEGSQSGFDLKAPLTWTLSSRPIDLPSNIPGNDNPTVENGYGRAMLNWYTIDPIFYSNQRPDEITDEDISDIYTSRVFINELFPQQDIASGQTTVLNTLDLAYYPAERGPYNFDIANTNGDVITTPSTSWAGITRQLTSTDFERANVEYIEFWLQDPFQESNTNQGGKLVFNLGNISEDILKDGRKQYENGLPDGTSNNDFTNETDWGRVPANQSLVYTFDSTGDARRLQDIGYDGINDADEQLKFRDFSALSDPSKDNYDYYLNATGSILERYKKYNGVEGNSPEALSNTNRGASPQPDVEDANKDNTMNTIDSYFEYEINVTPTELNRPDNQYIVDRKTAIRVLPNGQQKNVNWYQFRIPIQGNNAVSKNGITDLRSIRFARIYLRDFIEATVFRFGTLDLVRSDWRRYGLTLQPGIDQNPDDDNTDFFVGAVSTQENDGDYLSPPGVAEEQLNTNNTIIDQNEQSLVLNVCDLESRDARAVYKNINVDMRQYKKLRMFIHAEDANDGNASNNVEDGDVVAFIRLGNDLTQNYYQIEVPLVISDGQISESALWPEANEINLSLSILQQLKAKAIASPNFTDLGAVFYDVIDGELAETPVDNEFEGYVEGQHRVAIKGNPNFGDVRNLMIGVKNIKRAKKCGKFWFNELRMSDMDNEGGWAAVVSMDTNLADFASISATARQSTIGFGSIEQGPNERSREDVKQYDVVTNVNVGQLLPKKWGVQIPFNYGQGEELITPKYDQQFKDVTLDSRLNEAETDADRTKIKQQSESYTKRQSFNLIGVKKNRTGEAKPKPYDIENFTFNYSYNKVQHRDFEIENSLDQQVRAGVSYAYNFKEKSFEPFKKNDSLFTSKYLKFLKVFNVNLLPASFTVNTNINRQFNKQKFRDIELGGGDNIGVEELFKRNYTLDFQYNINWNLTKSLQLSYNASNSNIVRNYFIDNSNFLQPEPDPSLNVWDGFFDPGDPNRQYQQLQVNYTLPFDKFPYLNFIQSNYAYTGDFQWQKSSDLFRSIEFDGERYDLGNSIQNSNSHNITASLDMKRLYSIFGLKKKRLVKRQSNKKADSKTNNGKPKSTQAGKKIANTGIGLLTSIKRIQFSYAETNGTYLPGYTPTPGFIGTLKPTLGFTFGSQNDIRYLAARNGWLTLIPEFNQQYTKVKTEQLDFSANLIPINDLKIDFVANRTFSENTSENFNVTQGVYNPLNPNTFGNFNISTVLIKTAFRKSDEFSSDAFNDFRTNRIAIARRLAQERGLDVNDVDEDGFPKGYGKNSQAVLLPAFLSAYTGSKANSTQLDPIKDFPIPNWDIRYTGLMKNKWFKKRFKRFSVSHGYRSNYTVSQFRTNLEFDAQNPDELDQGGNFKSETLYSNVTLSEMFSPLIRLDFEMKNSIKILAEVRKDRLLSLSLDNNLLTEIQGKEYTIGLGYRIKDVTIRSKLAGPKKRIVSDLNMKADVSLRDNKTIIRYLDLQNNQITSGQTIWGLKYTADYAFSKHFNGIFYFDYTFSDYAISTAFPQTTIRSGITLRYNFGN